ncbi:MAG: hypothetical protein M3454_07495 [Actinomycetota bacterium]|nr:hypothetical protein [Actinomycetota bacterium]
MSYFTTFEGHVLDGAGEPLPPDLIELSLDAIMEALLERGVADATVGGTLARGVIEISMTVEAANLEEAQRVSHALLAEAILSLGSGHRSEVEWIASSARRSDADLVDA